MIAPWAALGLAVPLGFDTARGTADWQTWAACGVLLVLLILLERWARRWR